MHPALTAPVFLVAAALVLAGCGERADGSFQGYVEGEFVNVGAPLGGRLERLAVQRGDVVSAGAALYVLDAVSEIAAEREAEAQLAAAQARLDDLKRGRRLPEQAVTQAQIAQAESELQRATTQAARDEAQLRIGGIPQAQLDDSRSTLTPCRW